MTPKAKSPKSTNRQRGHIELDVADVDLFIESVKDGVGIRAHKVGFENANYVFKVSGQRMNVWCFIIQFYDPEFSLEDFNEWWVPAK